MSDKPPFYLSNPEIRKAMEDMGHLVRTVMETNLGDLKTAGADSNELTSALSNCAAHALDLMQLQLAARAEELGLPYAPHTQAAMIRGTLEDIERRAIILVARRAAEGRS